MKRDEVDKDSLTLSSRLKMATSNKQIEQIKQTALRSQFLSIQSGFNQFRKKWRNHLVLGACDG